jgi:hypothetical protein
VFMRLLMISVGVFGSSTCICLKLGPGCGDSARDIAP